MFENQNEITDLGISLILVVEEMPKEIRDKSDVECNFCQSAEDVPDLLRTKFREKESNGISWSVTWKRKHMWSALCQRKTQQRWLFLFSSRLFQTSISNNLKEREFRMSVSPRPEEP